MLMQRKKPIFTENLSVSDPELFSTIDKENKRQEQEIELIASENITSLAVMQAQGSVMTNKYAEGYSGKRYYGGCEFVDLAEDLAIKRIKELFNCEFANVQPHSGAQANGAVYFGLLKPGDTILGLSLAAGGHLTHGAAPPSTFVRAAAGTITPSRPSARMAPAPGFNRAQTRTPPLRV